MTKYNLAAKIIILTTLFPQEALVSSFVHHQSTVINTLNLQHQEAILQTSRGPQRNASISAATDDGNNNNISNTKNLMGGSMGNGSSASLGEKVRTFTIGYIDSLTDDDDDDAQFTNTKQRRKRVVLDMTSGNPTFTYNVNLPIGGLTMETEMTSRIGLSVREVEESGILSETCLELDSLRYVSLEEEMIRRKGMECSESENGPIGSIQTLEQQEQGPEDRKGVVVTSVVRGSLAWEKGVRAGDILSATSATLGDVSFVDSFG